MVAEDPIQQKIKRVERLLNRTLITEQSRIKSNAFYGSMSDDEIRDDAAHLLTDVYHIKDHLIKYLKNAHISSIDVEEIINKSAYLPIIADLANKDKHGTPLDREPRSKFNPYLAEVQRGLVPSNGKIKIQLLKGQPQLVVDKETPLVYTVVIRDEKNEKIGIVAEVADKALEHWQELCERIGVAKN